jgi:hypothetical protein
MIITADIRSTITDLRVSMADLHAELPRNGTDPVGADDDRRRIRRRSRSARSR